MVNPDPTTALVACQDGCGRMYAPCARSVHVEVFHAPDGEHPISDDYPENWRALDDGTD